MIDYAQKLAGNIVLYRKGLGITQEGLADQLGITFQAVSKWENVQCSPDIMLLPKLSEIFGVSIDALFGITPAVPAPEVASTSNASESEGARRKSLPWDDDDTLHVAIFSGHTLIEDHGRTRDFTFRYGGKALNVDCRCNIECETIEGNASAGGTVNCGEVNGNVSAGGAVNCEDVGGSVSCGGNINCGCVEGSVNCGGGITCDSVGGNVKAGGNVQCDSVEGNVEASGTATCDSVGGNVNARGDVQCDSVGGDVTAGGNLTCDSIGNGAKAGGNLTADSIHGATQVGGDIVECSEIHGDVTIYGNLRCEEINGDIMRVTKG